MKQSFRGNTFLIEETTFSAVPVRFYTDMLFYFASVASE